MARTLARRSTELALQKAFQAAISASPGFARFRDRLASLTEDQKAQLRARLRTTGDQLANVGSDTTDRARAFWDGIVEAFDDLTPEQREKIKRRGRRFAHFLIALIGLDALGPLLDG